MAMNFDFTPTMLFFVFLAACAGICLSISRVLCNIFNSPMSTTITMCLKDVVGTMMGIVLFHDVDLTPTFIIGLSMSLLGSCYYSYIKYKEQALQLPLNDRTVVLQNRAKIIKV